MKIKKTLLLLLFTSCIYAVPKVDSLLYQRIENIEKNQVTKQELEEQKNYAKERIDNEEKLNEKTLDSISKQLDAASYNLTLFGILFGIGAICLGIYVTYVERKIVKIGEENKALLLKNQNIKTEVEELNNLIQKDIFGLFLKIKREETVNILERLIKVPKDITHVCSELMSRELLLEDFTKLKQAYDKLKTLNNKDSGEENSYIRYTEKYKTLFFQHFLNDVIKNDDLRTEMLNFIHPGIHCAFENDIIKCTNDFTTAIFDLGIQKFKAEINKYFEGLSTSEHKNYLDVYQILFDKLQNKRTRFELFNIVNSNNLTRKAKINYGNLLFDKYSNDSASENEKEVFAELRKLISEEIEIEETQKQQVEKKLNAAQEKKAKLEEQKRIAEEAKNKTEKQNTSS